MYDPSARRTWLVHTVLGRYRARIRVPSIAEWERIITTIIDGQEQESLPVMSIVKVVSLKGKRKTWMQRRQA